MQRPKTIDPYVLILIWACLMLPEPYIGIFSFAHPKVAPYEIHFKWPCIFLENTVFGYIDGFLV